MFFKTFLNFTRWVVWPIIPGFIMISAGSVIPQISLADVFRNFNPNTIMSEFELETCKNNVLTVVESLQKELDVYKKSTPKSYYQKADDIASQIKKEYSKDYLSQLSRDEIRQLVNNHPLILELQGNFKSKLCKKIVETIVEIVILLLLLYAASKILKVIREWLHYCDLILNPEEFLNLG